MNKPIEIVVLAVGGNNIDECLSSLQHQTNKDFVINIIRDKPLYDAIKESIDKNECEYRIGLGSDMTLYPTAVEILYGYIKNKDIASAVGLLNDPIVGYIYGVHIWRMKYLKKIEIKNQIGWDRWALREIYSKWGLKEHRLLKVLGDHKTELSSEAYFKRFFRVGQKFASFKDVGFEDFDILCNKWLTGRNKHVLAGLIGFCNGMLNVKINEPEKDYKTFCVKEWYEFNALKNWKGF